MQTLWASRTGQKMTEPPVLHSANMKELILSPCWLGHTQILGAEFECDLPAPRLPHVAQVRLTASLKAEYGNQLKLSQIMCFSRGEGGGGWRWLMIGGGSVVGTYPGFQIEKNLSYYSKQDMTQVRDK